MPVPPAGRGASPPVQQQSQPLWTQPFPQLYPLPQHTSTTIRTRMIQSQELSLLLQHIPLPRFLFDRLSYAAVTGNRAWTGQKSGNCIPLPDGDRESKEEPMSEYRRDDTASWDAQEVRQAQGARREPTPAHHSKSRHRRRRSWFFICFSQFLL